MLTFPKRAARNLLESFIDWYGYELKEKTKPLRRTDRFLSYVRRQGFSPQTIIDIGVGRGTEWLHTSFPNAYFILIEANPEFRESIETILNKHQGEFHLTAVGSNIGKEILRVNVFHPTSSSLSALEPKYREKLMRRGSSEKIHAIEVPMTTLDTIAFRRLKLPILIKLDIEGHEIEALKGGRALLRQTEMVIAEVSVAARFQGAASCGEFLAFMEACGFALFDVVDLGQLGADGPLVSMDVALLRKDSRLWCA